MSVWNIHSWPAVTLASLAMSTYQFHDPPELHLFVIAVAWEGWLRLWSDGHLGLIPHLGFYCAVDQGTTFDRNLLLTWELALTPLSAEYWMSVVSMYHPRLTWNSMSCQHNGLKIFPPVRLVRRLQNYSLLSPYGALRMGVDMYGQSKSTIELIIQPILSL